MSIVSRIERILFGASAEERVEQLNRIIDQHIEKVIDGALDRLIAEDAADGAQEAKEEA